VRLLPVMLCSLHAERRRRHQTFCVENVGLGRLIFLTCSFWLGTYPSPPIPISKAVIGFFNPHTDLNALLGTRSRIDFQFLAFPLQTPLLLFSLPLGVPGTRKCVGQPGLLMVATIICDLTPLLPSSHFSWYRNGIENRIIG